MLYALQQGTAIPSCGAFFCKKERKMEDQTYYYLKLKENFFDTDEIKVLESMENGYLYSNILLKLYLKALKNKGKLTFNDFIPYDVKMLATITNHNVDVVNQALKIFQSMGLIEVLDNGAIYMLNMQQMIGSITSEGIRKAEYRERIRLEKENGTKLGQCPNIISMSNSNYNSTSNSLLEHKEKVVKKEKEKERERNLEKEKHPTYEDVVEYAKSRGREDLAQKFYDYYTETGWRKGDGTKVKSWKGQFITWEMKTPKPKCKFEDFDDSLVEYARELANGKSDNYVLAILNNWKSQNITTLEMAKKSNELFIKGVGVKAEDYVLKSQDKYDNLFDDLDNIEI